MEPAPDKRYSPVAANGRMLREAPTTHPNQPLLVFPHDGATVTIPYIAKAWKKAQHEVGVATPHTVHAIRKAVATTAYASGNTELEVRRFGGWASTAHGNYIRTVDSPKVNRALIQAINHN